MWISTLSISNIWDFSGSLVISQIIMCLKYSHLGLQPHVTYLPWLSRITINYHKLGHICFRIVDISYDDDSERPEDNDNILSYACKVLTLGSLYLDAIWEGDGSHILRCWKYIYFWHTSSPMAEPTILQKLLFY